MSDALLAEMDAIAKHKREVQLLKASLGAWKAIARSRERQAAHTNACFEVAMALVDCYAHGLRSGQPWPQDLADKLAALEAMT